ncbi:DNA adenine methylase [uncultured Microbulbifer sp.]|uniref:DNA adenine methylase n=1 Tax=uncultured Microbulbifer sp. TaxID=348147 RepID=UPI0025D2C12B|nr:DNA adenine methylase [uncultured Microbulbifer sp.]
MSFRYIGSKARVVDAILERVGKPNGGMFIDAFSGTGAVAVAASNAGWPVLVNDNLSSSAIMSFARVISEEQVAFTHFAGYENAISALNEASPIRGFIHREYSPASADHCDVARMYFTEDNATKIDGVRKVIESWAEKSLVTKLEEKLLIADVMGAANRVANTAGTYGCFLSKWQRQSRDQFTLTPRALPKLAPPASMSIGDVSNISCTPDDTVYLDPPYTKRQYAAYYHILETIALGDEPLVKGVCGIRPWQEKASDFCYKVRAAKALNNLIQSLPAKRIFLSYSTEGHVAISELENILGNLGKVETCELDQIGRYRPNRAASEAGSLVGEILFCLEKRPQKGRAAA